MSTYPGRIEGEQGSHPWCWSKGSPGILRCAQMSRGGFLPSEMSLLFFPSFYSPQFFQETLLHLSFVAFVCALDFFFLDKLENSKVKKNPPETTPSLGRAEIATEELGAAVPGVLGGDLHIRMGVVGFCP